MGEIGSALIALALAGTATMPQEELSCDFEDLQAGGVAELSTDVGLLVCEPGDLRIVEAPVGRPGDSRALRVPSGDDVHLTLELSEAARECGSISFRVRREGKRRPFSLFVAVDGGSPRASAVSLTGRVGSDEFEVVDLSLGESPEAVVLVMSSPGAKGLILDDIVARPPAPMEVVGVEIEQHVRPLVLGQYVDIARVTIMTRGDRQPLELRALDVTAPGQVEGVTVRGIRLRDVMRPGTESQFTQDTDGTRHESQLPARTSLRTKLALGRSEYVASIRVDAADDADAASALGIEVPIEVGVAIDGQPRATGAPRAPARTAARVGVLAGAARKLPSPAYATSFDDGAAWQVIVTEDPDDPSALALHRSEDGGLTWTHSALRPAVGAGRIVRPTIVRDVVEEKLLMLLGWEPEGTPKFGQGRGVDQTPQLVLVESTDAGRTWSEPRNITEPVKDLQWTRLEPAGGRGVRTSQGRLALPAIVHREKAGVDTPSFAALISADGGATWRATPVGSVSSTSPALVEAGDGALMVNAADLRGGRRVVRTVRERDAAWLSSPVRRDLPLACAGGAGALVHIGRETTFSMDGRLVFLNAAVSQRPQRDMTIQGSNETGATWLDEKATLLDDGRGVGAPALGLVRSDVIGAVYRSSDGDLVFQRLALDDVVDPVATFGSVTGGR